MLYLKAETEGNLGITRVPSRGDWSKLGTDLAQADANVCSPEDLPEMLSPFGQPCQ